MASTTPITTGTYREITSHLCNQIASQRSSREQFASWIETPIHLIVPSRGVAEAIVSRTLQQRPSGITGLRIQTLEGFALSMVNNAGDYPHVATEVERLLTMELAVRSASDPLFDSRGAASLLNRSYRDLRDSGTTLSDFEAAVSRGRVRGRERSRRIATVIARYEELIAESGAIDPAGIHEKAAHFVGELADTPSVILFGFYDATGIQMRLIESLARSNRISAAYLPARCERDGSCSAPHAFAERFARRLLDLLGDASVENAPIVGPAAPAKLARARTRHDELREVARAVAERIADGADPRGIAIVCRSIDPQEARLLERYASELGFELQTTSGTPLGGSRIGRAIARLLRVRERGFRRGDVVEVLRDGWSSQTVHESAADEVDRVTRAYEIAGGPPDAVQRAIDRVAHRGEVPKPLRIYGDLVSEIEEATRNFEHERAGSEWSEAITSLLKHFRAETDSDLYAIASLEEIAQLHRRAPFRDSLVPVRFLERALEQWPALDRGSGSAPAVWFGDVMKARGRSFQHLFVFGMEDRRFPQERVEDALIRNDDRDAIGIREITDGAAEERFLFQLLLDAASESVTFSFASADRAGRSLRPSFLLKNLAIEQDPASIREIVHDFGSYTDAHSSRSTAKSERERRAARLRAGDATELSPNLRRQLEYAAAVLGSSKYDSYLELSEPLREAIQTRLQTISPTDLETFGECPQRFLFMKIAGVREIEDPEHEVQIEKRKRGKLEHIILERFYRSLTEQEIASSFDALSPALRERLHEVIREEFDRHEQAYPATNKLIRELEQRASERALEEFVAFDVAELAESGFRPAHFEFQFGAARDGREPDAPAIALETAGVTISVRGMIDRIDIRPGELESEVRVIDYKTGKAIKQEKLAEKIDAGHCLQLPLYAIAATRVLGIADDRVIGAIRPVRAFKKGEKFTFKLGEKRPILDHAIETFVTAISKGKYPAFVNDEWCRFCPVGDQCRSRHEPEEGRRLGRFDSVLALLSGDPP